MVGVSKLYERNNMRLASTYPRNQPAVTLCFKLMVFPIFLHFSKPGRGFTFDDPDLHGNICIILPSLIYLSYNIQREYKLSCDTVVACCFSCVVVVVSRTCLTRRCAVSIPPLSLRF